MSVIGIRAKERQRRAIALSNLWNSLQRQGRSEKEALEMACSYLELDPAVGWNMLNELVRSDVHKKRRHTSKKA